MATLNNEDLRNAYHFVATIENLLQKEIRQIRGNKSYLDKIVPEELVKVYSLKEKTALSFADGLFRTSYENSVVTLVSTFEKVVFTKYKTTVGTIRGIVAAHAAKPMDFYRSRENFVNGSIDKLSGIIYLIEGHITNDLMDKLKIIKDHRNYIAHGKRDVAPPAVELKLSEIAKTLDEVIEEIEA